MSDDLDLRGMIREPDHDTSVAAAAHHEPTRTELQNRVEAAIRREAPRHDPQGLNDEELRLLPEFVQDEYAESTVRKRRTELYQQGRLVKVGKRPNAAGFMMTVWGPAPPKRVWRSLRPAPPVVVKRKR
jgi:hypothetical protein